MKKRFRISSWLSSFIPILLSFVFLWVWYAGSSLDFELLRTIGLFTLSGVGFASLGYLINDYFDRQEDEKVGKENGLQNLASWKVYLILVLVSLIALLPWLGLPLNKQTLFLLALQVVLYLIYNAPPLRFKSKPYISNLLDALYAYIVPFLLARIVFYQSLQLNQGPDYLLALGSALFLIVGSRNILIHQMNDVDTDRTLQKRTTPIVLSSTALKQLLYFVLIVEIAFTLLFLGLLVSINIFFGILILIAVLVWLERLYMYKSNLYKTNDLVSLGLFGNSVFQFYLPLTALGVLLYTDNYLWVIPGIFFALLTASKWAEYLLKPNLILKYLWYDHLENFWYHQLRPLPGKWLNQLIGFFQKDSKNEENGK
jgi:4-hydroxybenzoate polyprenyltransferase